MFKRTQKTVDKIFDAWDAHAEDDHDKQKLTSYFDFAALPEDVNVDDYASELDALIVASVEADIDSKMSISKSEVQNIHDNAAVEIMTMKAIAQSHQRFLKYAGQSPEFEAFMDAFALSGVKEGSGKHTIAREAVGGHFIPHVAMGELGRSSYKNAIAYAAKNVPVVPDLSCLPSEITVSADRVERLLPNKTPWFDAVRMHEGVHAIQHATVPFLHAVGANTTLLPNLFETDARTSMHARYLIEVDAYFKMEYLPLVSNVGKVPEETMERVLERAKVNAPKSEPIDDKSFDRRVSAKLPALMHDAKIISAHRGEPTANFRELAVVIADEIKMVKLTENDIRQIGSSGAGGLYNTFTENFEPDAPIRAEFLKLTYPIHKALRGKFLEATSGIIMPKAAPIDSFFPKSGPEAFLRASIQGKGQLSVTTEYALHRMGAKTRPKEPLFRNNYSKRLVASLKK